MSQVMDMKLKHHSFGWHCHGGSIPEGQRFQLFFKTLPLGQRFSDVVTRSTMDFATGSTIKISKIHTLPVGQRSKILKFLTLPVGQRSKIS